MNPYVVTGASSGIGAATVRALRALGAPVIAVARRRERLEALAVETGCEVVVADLAEADDVAGLVAHVGDRPLAGVVANAGGARGVERVEDADLAKWDEMYRINVLATVRTVAALLPALRADGGGDIVVVTSQAAHGHYPGGAGYTAAKHAEAAIPATLRLELVGEPIRVVEIAPGLVRTEEFSLRRLGSQEQADAVYDGVAEPLVADDVADAIVWTLTRPRHVNIDRLDIKPVAQANSTLIARSPRA